MDLESVKKVLESFCKSESASNIQHLKNDKNLVNGIIQNLPHLYAHEFSDPVYNSLFELYRQSGRGGQLFVLQFVPVLVWTYLSATTRRDELVYGKLEALLLAIYNAEVVNGKGEQKIKSFRLPSLSRPSIYHEPYQSSTTLSTLTETALSRHEQSETIVTLPGPGKQLNRVTATHRLSVLSVILHQYNSNIVYMSEASHHSFCVMALRLAKCGFYKLCQRSKEETVSESYFSSEELSRLVNHPRITLSPELIQEMTYGIYFLMYNGQRTLATKALEDLHWRASHSLFAPAHLLTDAIKHSLDETDGLPKDGPLGLEISLSDTQGTQPISSKTVPTVSSTVSEAPATPGKIMALSTSGMKVTRVDYEFPEDNAVDTEDIEVEVHSRKASSSSDHSAKEGNKSHKKAHSLGHFKLPFMSAKEHIELHPIQGMRPNSSDSPRVVLSEINVPSEKDEDVELLQTSLSDEVFDHKL